MGEAWTRDIEGVHPILEVNEQDNIGDPLVGSNTRMH
jgi:hypothetical protein